MLHDINKLFVFKSLLKTPSNVLPLYLKQTFLPMIWIFTECEGKGIESRLPFKIFSTLDLSWLVFWLQSSSPISFFLKKKILGDHLYTYWSFHRIGRWPNTKHKMSADGFVAIPNQKEKWPSCPLFELKQEQLTFWSSVFGF